MKVVAGDLPQARIFFMKTFFGRRKGISIGLLRPVEIPFTEIESASLMDRDKAANWTSKIGWAGAGGMAFGPAGMLLGAMTGGNRDRSTIEIVLKDGRSALIEGKTSDTTRILRACYKGRKAKG